MPHSIVILHLVSRCFNAIYLSSVHRVFATETIYVIAALLQSDGVSSPGEHVCDEHALFQ